MKKLVAFLCVSLILTGCAETPEPEPEEVKAPVTCEYPPSGDPAKPVDPPTGDNVSQAGEASVTMMLNDEEIEITLDREHTPCTVNSFLSLASQGYYDNTRCHRLTDTGIFVLQCGDPSATGRGGPGYTFSDELSGQETYPAGTVAMANAGPNTNGSQFFFVWQDTDLPPSYTVFGQIDEDGLEAIRGIASQGVDGRDGMSPIAPAEIKQIVMG